ncbi:U6 snRNA-associated Sm-like protein LSm7 [Candida tropicalis]
MFRTTIRRVSTKSIPYEPIPKNKYNQNRSVFNFKPVPTEGLVYNPPAAIVKPYMQTPYIFLPPNDPRREFAKQNCIDPSIVKEMPVIREFKAAHQREYNVTAETITKIKQLIKEDPERWTSKAISKEFNIELVKLHYFLRGELEKKLKPQPKQQQDRRYRNSQQGQQQYRRRNNNSNVPKQEGPKREAILDLNKYKDQDIRVKLIGGRQITGTLKGFDQLMNLVLENVQETLRGMYI